MSATHHFLEAEIMPYESTEFSEAPATRVLKSVESTASSNIMTEVQNYQEQRRGANLIGTAETLTGDEAVKKMFNGIEVEKILKDFVINEDPNCMLNKITKGLKGIQELRPKEGSVSDDKKELWKDMYESFKIGGAFR